MEHETYVGAIRDAVERYGDRPLYTFLRDGTGNGVTWTYLDLHREASSVARLLRSSVRPGDRVMLMAAPGLDYIATFVGCLYAGVIAVPAYPPSTLNARHGLDRIYAIVQDAGVAAVLVDDTAFAALSPYASHVPQRLLTVAEAREAGGGDDLHVSARRDDIAFLQYTSGSTGVPKGVMVTQGNLVVNIAMMNGEYGSRPGEVLVSWLPPYHDMGLIAMLLAAPLLGLHSVFMPPTAFLRQPVRWLQAISRFGAGISGAPNFAYEACVRKVKDADLEGLDLSTWRIAVNGAEPVRASTIERFVERFSSRGFREGAFRPAYGLAETTLMTSTGSFGHGASIVEVDATALAAGRLRLAAGSGDPRRLVTCGSPPDGAEITVVDPQTGVPLEPGQVGELVVRGPHVTRGYWGRELDDRFAGDSVRTGDLGCFLDGELVVTGRGKDLIIIRGQNHYPQDVERTVEEAHPGFRPGCGAAFTVDRDGEERLVIVQEVTPGQVDEPAAAVDAVRRGVTVAHGIAPDAVVLAPPGAVAKTSSGKIRRNDTRELYLSDGLGTVFSWGSGDSLVPRGPASATDSGAGQRPTLQG